MYTVLHTSQLYSITVQLYTVASSHAHSITVYLHALQQLATYNDIIYTVVHNVIAQLHCITYLAIYIVSLWTLYYMALLCILASQLASYTLILSICTLVHVCIVTLQYTWCHCLHYSQLASYIYILQFCFVQCNCKTVMLNDITDKYCGSIYKCLDPKMDRRFSPQHNILAVQ